MSDEMNDTADLASRPTRMIEAGVLFGIAIDAIRAIKVDPRQGGQRSALVTIVFSMIALESFVNEMTEQAQNMSSEPAEVGTFAQMMGDADDDHASIDFRVRLRTADLASQRSCPHEAKQTFRLWQDDDGRSTRQAAQQIQK
jgi:hypothetical protein